MGLNECLLVIMLFGHGVASVNGQDKGFISLNCGGGDYVDDSTGIEYVSDAPYITSGVNGKIKGKWKNKHAEPLRNLRNFPLGRRNCYYFDLSKGDKYLIRAEFLYGNYDGLYRPPVFNVYIGSLLQDTVSPQDTVSTLEVIHELRSRHLHLCLAKIDSYVPFISTLLLRPINKNAYKIPGTLQSYLRYDFGKSFRFKDALSRIWEPKNEDYFVRLSTTLPISSVSVYQAPELVMMSAVAHKNISTPIKITFTLPNQGSGIYAFFYFAELLELQIGESREMMIYYNGKIWARSVSPPYLGTRVVSSTIRLFPSKSNECQFVITEAGWSTHPPLLNALEVYIFKEFSEVETNERDVTAIIEIKKIYSLNKTNWEGDPCIPATYMWEGVSCNTDYNNTRISSLNLSSSSLQGVVAPEIFSISQLLYLDLSNNNLTGTIPDFLSRMTQLKFIDLSGNMFNGTIPPALLEKSVQGLLTLSLENNPDLRGKYGSCNNTSEIETSLPIKIVAIIASILIGISAIATLRVILKKRKRKHDEGLRNTNPPNDNPAGLVIKREVKYSEIERSTDNFTRILGKGGFGVVYHGIFEHQQVAIKLLDRSVHADEQFRTKVGILLRVHHKNLVSLNGYCYEQGNLALVYEFMAKGDLKDHLSGKSGHILSWETRLKIATQVAQGLEYLHHGCHPPVIHRDIKTRNILLDENYEAKLGDFGLSRLFPTDHATHVSTVVAGTRGYLDPEYVRSNWLTIKSDVFSFGIVLLELITNQSVIDQRRERSMIDEWAHSKVTVGETADIVDLQLRGQFDSISLHKAVDIALACVNEKGANRPTMNRVILELNGCLALEIARTQRDCWSESSVLPR